MPSKIMRGEEVSLGKIEEEAKQCRACPAPPPRTLSSVVPQPLEKIAIDFPLPIPIFDRPGGYS